MRCCLLYNFASIPYLAVTSHVPAKAASAQADQIGEQQAW